jgi:hypothetical protein
MLVTNRPWGSNTCAGEELPNCNVPPVWVKKTRMMTVAWAGNTHPMTQKGNISLTHPPINTGQRKY